jgi:AcrR family transcriptional regulator
MRAMTSTPGAVPSVTVARHTAEERRDEIIAAAVVRFGATGLYGTSTETIARDVGVSQPYLFRLFGTKKELFMAAVEWGFRETLDAFRLAGEAATDPHDAFRRIGDAYVALIRDRRYLDIQMQAYATTHDDDVRRIVEVGFGDLATEVVRHTRATPQQLAAFLGRGMLLNVATAMGVIEHRTGWPVWVREGCVGGLED